MRSGPGAGRHASDPRPGRRRSRHGMDLRVFARNIQPGRAGLCAGGLRRGQRHLEPQPGAQDDHQSAIHRGMRQRQRLRRSDRMDAPPPGAARQHRAQRASAQRPWHGRRSRRAGGDGRRRPRRGLPVRQRRAHRQRRPGDAGDEPGHAGHTQRAAVQDMAAVRECVEACNQLPVDVFHPYAFRPARPAAPRAGAAARG